MKELIMQALVYVLEIALLALIGVITHYVKTALIPWLKDKQLYTTVQRFVQAAEKLSASGVIGSGDDKKDLVVRLLQEKGIEYTQEVNALIESAVEELDWMKGEITYAFNEDSEVKKR